MQWNRNACLLFSLATVLQFLFSCNNNTDLLGDDIQLFKEVTPFAKAVASEEIDKIEDSIRKQPKLLNYQEPRFGQTLLIWSILNDRYKSAETLLKLGADPNLQNYDGLSALMYAAKWQIEEWKGDPKYLRLVLNYGGNPNAIAAPKKPPVQILTPLMAAVHSFNLENLKILINAGADPNYSDRCESVLATAFDLGQIDMVRYLIIDKNVKLYYSDCKTLSGQDIRISAYLRGMTYPLDSREHSVKMEIVEHLKTKNIGYRKEPISKH